MAPIDIRTFAEIYTSCKCCPPNTPFNGGVFCYLGHYFPWGDVSGTSLLTQDDPIHGTVTCAKYDRVDVTGSYLVSRTDAATGDSATIREQNFTYFEDYINTASMSPRLDDQDLYVYDRAGNIDTRLDVNFGLTGNDISYQSNGITTTRTWSGKTVTETGEDSGGPYTQSGLLYPYSKPRFGNPSATNRFTSQVTDVAIFPKAGTVGLARIWGWFNDRNGSPTNFASPNTLQIPNETDDGISATRTYTPTELRLEWSGTRVVETRNSSGDLISTTYTTYNGSMIFSRLVDNSFQASKIDDFSISTNVRQFLNTNNQGEVIAIPFVDMTIGGDDNLVSGTLYSNIVTSPIPDESCIEKNGAVVTSIVEGEGPPPPPPSNLPNELAYSIFGTTGTMTNENTDPPSYFDDVDNFFGISYDPFDERWYNDFGGSLNDSTGESPQGTYSDGMVISNIN